MAEIEDTSMVAAAGEGRPLLAVQDHERRKDADPSELKLALRVPLRSRSPAKKSNQISPQREIPVVSRAMSEGQPLLDCPT